MPPQFSLPFYHFLFILDVARVVQSCVISCQALSLNTRHWPPSNTSNSSKQPWKCECRLYPLSAIAIIRIRYLCGACLRRPESQPKSAGSCGAHQTMLQVIHFKQFHSNHSFQTANTFFFVCLWSSEYSIWRLKTIIRSCQTEIASNGAHSFTFLCIFVCILISPIFQLREKP